MRPYEFANLGVGILTLLVIVYYTRQTKRIADFTSEQASALPRPLIVIQSHSDGSDDAIIEGKGDSLEADRDVRIRNAGNAVAIRVRFSCRVSNGRTFTREFAWVDPGSALIAVARQALDDPAPIEVEYESIAGLRMATRATVTERRYLSGVELERLGLAED